MRGCRVSKIPFVIALASASLACGGHAGDDDGGRVPGARGGSGGGGGVSGSMGGSGAIGGVAQGQGGVGPIAFGGKTSCDSATSTGCVDVAPSCGDGKINVDGEDCDDGNPLPGDGCSGRCKVEKNFMCPTPGQPCVSTIVCGDGMLGPGEGCDDANTMAGDGCAANCRTVEPGFVCRTPGKPCTRAYLCGDGLVDPNEGCDDKNTMDGDGCDSRCRIELGFKCDGMPSKCTATKCGDGKQEGAESCDDGNNVPFDGCSADCRAEPSCQATGACASGCGDGILFAAEQCDDGNLRDGDGCSSKCEIEPAFVCTNDVPCTMTNGRCSISVPVVYRDFNAAGSPGGHPDFQPGTNSGVTVAKGLVQATWDKDKKPVFSGKGTCYNDKGVGSDCATPPAFIHSVASFAQWYRDGAPNGGPIPSKLVLWDNGNGGYVNRFNANGDPLTTYPNGGTINGVKYPPPVVCSSTDCTDPACATCPNTTQCTPEMVCLDDCTPFGNNTQACYAQPAVFDGSPLFFPIDPPTAGILNDDRRGAKLPEQYGFTGWPWEKAIGTSMPALGLKASGVKCVAGDDANSSGWCHNFSFTTEVKYWFKYDPAASARLDFTGDDDVWVFVNGKLAVDLGGWHVPLDGTVTLNAASATTYGLEAGKVYQIGVFQAERETEGSSFRLTLSGFNFTPSDCHTDCGDGVVAAGEACDDGTDKNTGEYNACTPNCQLGPRCGDAIVQKDYGEACDDGTAANTGAFGGCAPNCQIGPYCGDGAVDPDNEECDDGMNVGDYGGCAPGCKIGPHCGDGKLQTDYEECDDGNTVNGDGCSAGCKPEIPK